MRLLVIEDRVSEFERLRTALVSRDSYDLLYASTLQEALRLLRNGGCDLALFALAMPEGGGLAGFQILHRRHPTLPVVLLARAEQEAEAWQGVAAGAEDFVMIDGERYADELSRGVRLALARSSRYQQALADAQRLDLLQQRQQQHLAFAERVQRSLLPTGLPTVPGVSLATRYHPAERLSGDILNAFPLPGEHLAFYVLDVSGHGIPASLMAVQLSRMLHPPVDEISHALSLPLHQPAQLFAELNRLFPMEENNGQYFTMVYGLLHLPSGKLRLCVGGHPPPLLLHAGRVQTIEARGLPIGCLSSASWNEVELTLHPRDRLLCYSDGLSEALPHDDESGSRLFGADRIRELFSEYRSAPLEALCDSVIDAVLSWTAPATPSDDITMLVLGIGPNGSSGRLRAVR